MNKTELREFLELDGRCRYNPENKERFRRLAMRLLRAVRAELGLANTEVRYNAAGIACSGDAVLHADNLYVSLNMDNGIGILYRTCQGKKDYTGGRNNWFRLADLAAYGVIGFCERIRFLLGEAVLPDRERMAA